MPATILAAKPTFSEVFFSENDVALRSVIKVVRVEVFALRKTAHIIGHATSCSEGEVAVSTAPLKVNLRCIK